MKDFKQLALSLKKEYDEASDQQKKVMIAQDILSLIKSNKIKGFCGSYVESITFSGKEFYNFNVPEELKEASVQEQLISDVDFECEVCAIGAEHLAHIMRNNECGIKQLLNKDHNEMLEVSPFSDVELRLLEDLFESTWNYDEVYELIGVEDSKLNHFLDDFREWKELEDSTECLIYLYSRVIEFEGDVLKFIKVEFDLYYSEEDEVEDGD